MVLNVCWKVICVIGDIFKWVYWLIIIAQNKIAIIPKLKFFLNQKKNIEKWVTAWPIPWKLIAWRPTVWKKMLKENIKEFGVIEGERPLAVQQIS